MNEIAKNLKSVNEKIKAACDKAGRDFADVTLVAVSKTKPNEMLMEAYEEGVRDFGENHVQELVGKMNTLPTDIRWHMIGHLQTNKVKYIVGRVYMIHSVDTLKLAKEISKEAQKKGVTVPVTVEVNIAGEESKFGGTLSDGEELVKEVSKLPGIEVKGLMCVAPYTENPEDNRGYFKSLKAMADKLSLKELSMGMSGDYEVAVEEGATLVRVGSSIFGARNYN
ncbi:MAG: YggS family pyridoxal phosphate-dependent enzyme [Lachnospiraceae bacterium]|nr:YggS family pyridoxal phosphate-dependent enzyme [Lachnospiraceae bacterium]